MGTVLWVSITTWTWVRLKQRGALCLVESQHMMEYRNIWLHKLVIRIKLAMELARINCVSLQRIFFVVAAACFRFVSRGSPIGVKGMGEDHWPHGVLYLISRFNENLERNGSPLKSWEIHFYFFTCIWAFTINSWVYCSGSHHLPGGVCESWRGGRNTASFFFSAYFFSLLVFDHEIS